MLKVLKVHVEGGKLYMLKEERYTLLKVHVEKGKLKCMLQFMSM